MSTTVLPEQPSDVDLLLANLLEDMREARRLAEYIGGDLRCEADKLMLASQPLERTLKQFISQSPAERS